MESVGEKNFYLVFSLEEEKIECVRGKLIVMCEEMLFMETNACKKEHGRNLCVTSSCSGVHGMISMNKPMDFLLK